MKITEIIVFEGRGYNHPYESYSNFKQYITLKASIGEEEYDVKDSIKRLQEKASTEIEDIKKRTLESLNKLKNLQEVKQQIDRELDRIESGDVNVPF